MIVEIESVDRNSQHLRITSGSFTIADQTLAYPPRIQEIADIEVRVCRSLHATGDRKLQVGDVTKDVVIDRIAGAVYVGRSRLNEVLVSMQHDAAGAKTGRIVPQELIRHIPKRNAYEEVPMIEPENDTAELAADIERTELASGYSDDEQISAVADKIQRIKMLAKSRKRR